MQGGRWLAKQAMELLQAREGAAGQGTTHAEGGDPAVHAPQAPFCYPMLWRLSAASLVDLASAGGLSVQELIEHGARRAQA